MKKPLDLMNFKFCLRLPCQCPNDFTSLTWPMSQTFPTPYLHKQINVFRRQTRNYSKIEPLKYRKLLRCAPARSNWGPSPRTAPHSRPTVGGRH